MLTVTARTHRKSPCNGKPAHHHNRRRYSDVTSEAGDGFVTGVASGKKFAFATRPGSIYHVENMETDALAMTWSGSRLCYEATVFEKTECSLSAQKLR